MIVTVILKLGACYSQGIALLIGPAGWGIGLGVMGCLLSNIEAMSAAVRPKIKLGSLFDDA